jgi:hypothetical protein
VIEIENGEPCLLKHAQEFGRGGYDEEREIFELEKGESTKICTIGELKWKAG